MTDPWREEEQTEVWQEEHRPRRVGPLAWWHWMAVFLLLLALASLLVIDPHLSQQQRAAAGSVTVPCVLSEWITSAHQTTQRGWMVTLTRHWYCAPVAFRFLTFAFGDRTSQAYWCLLNCFAGSRTFLHRYIERGTFVLVGGASVTVVSRVRYL